MKVWSALALHDPFPIESERVMLPLIFACSVGIAMIVVLPATLTIIFASLLSRTRRLKTWRSALFWAAVLLAAWNYYVCMPELNLVVDTRALWYWVCIGFMAAAMLKAFAIHVERSVSRRSA